MKYTENHMVCPYCEKVMIVSALTLTEVDPEALKVPPPSPRPKAGQKAREDLESRLMPILKKWWDGYQRQDKANTLKEYCDLRWPERGDMSLSLFLMNKVNAHRMTIPQMRTILNILEAE